MKRPNDIDLTLAAALSVYECRIAGHRPQRKAKRRSEPPAETCTCACGKVGYVRKGSEYVQA